MRRIGLAKTSTRISISTACVLLAHVSTPSTGAAQRRVTPSAEIGFAAGSGQGGSYRDRGVGGLRLSGAVRIRQSPTRIWFFEIAKESFAIGSGHRAICVLQATGECLPTFPEFSVIGATTGLVRQGGSQWEVRAGLGGGSFATDDRGETRVGGIVAQFDGALFFGSHLGLLAGTRPFVVPSFRHDLLWIVPLSVGVQIR
jgi:hypothetical protein